MKQTNKMDRKDIIRLVRENILAMAPYSTARDECAGAPEVFLDANENPYRNGFNRYPDPHQRLLKKQIARLKEVPAENIFIGNGSDEAIDLAFRVFCRPGVDNAVSIAPTYGMYGVAAATNDIEFREVPLGEDFALDTDALLAATDNNTKLLFICSPNNPTGNAFPRTQLLDVLSRFKGMVVVDEAYADFSDEPSLLSDLEAYPNLIVLQTFSKAWGMAGLRVGLAFADEAVIGFFSNVKYPYNINGLTQKIVLSRLEGLSSPPMLESTLSERERLAVELAACPMVQKVWPSQANFLLVRCTDPGEVYDRLMEKKIIVRDRSRVRGCEGCLRITVGTRQENDRLICTMKALAAAREQGQSCLAGIAAENADSQGAVSRQASVFRATSETGIAVMVDLDGNSPSCISTGIGFFNHMLDQIVHHAGISLVVVADGDLNVDEHHTVEDVAIVLGQALSKALGTKAGIGRYGFSLPMDESEATILLDLGGRIDFRWEVDFQREKIGDMPTEMFSHFFKSLSESLRCNLHIRAGGENAHHKIEGVFKAFARALKMAVARDAGSDALPSSKGVL